LPRATGLTSYPSGYLGIAVGWAGFAVRPNSGGFAKFAIFARSPNSPAVYALPFADGALWRGCLARHACPCWLAVVTWTPLGHCLNPRSETSRGPDPARTRFLFAPRRSVPCSRFLVGATPPRGTGESCLATVAGSRGGRTSSAILSPVARDYPWVCCTAFFITASNSR
jgi:hypothetical protein